MIMTLLLIVSAWTLVLWLATGLCAAARLGDRTQVEDVHVKRTLHKIITPERALGSTIGSAAQRR